MSYTSVEAPDSTFRCPGSPSQAPTTNRINTHVGYSDDHGATWTEHAVVNSASNFCTSQPVPANMGTWQYEVSTIVRDTHASPGESWKMFFHRYLAVDTLPPNSAARVFSLGWIGYRTSSDPRVGWSNERKLFVGSGYDPAADAFLGAPELKLNVSFPELSDCSVFTEPGTLNTSSGLFVSLSCHTGTSSGSRVILLRYADGTWQYRGVLLRDSTDAPILGFSGIGATAIFEHAGRNYLLATATIGDIYKNCMLMEILDIHDPARARVDRDLMLKPKVLATITGSPGDFVGACGYHSAAFEGGFLYSEIIGSDAPAVFQIFKSFVTPPNAQNVDAAISRSHQVQHKEASR